MIRIKACKIVKLLTPTILLAITTLFLVSSAMGAESKMKQILRLLKSVSPEFFIPREITNCVIYRRYNKEIVVGFAIPDPNSATAIMDSISDLHQLVDLVPSLKSLTPYGKETAVRT